MTAPIEPWDRRRLDPELELDLEAERAVPVASDEAKARIFAAVQVAIVQPPTPPGTGASASASTSTATATTAGGGAALKALAAVAVLAGVVGVGVLSRRESPAPAVTTAPTVVEAPRSAPPPPPSAVAVPTAAPAPVQVAVAPPPSAPAAVSSAQRAAVHQTAHAAVPDEDAPVAAEPGRPHPVATPTSTLGDEQALLEAARRALAAGDPRGALAAVSTHERRYAAGGLAEERDVLRIQAHARAGRMDEARAYAERFRARYPRSLLRAAVDYALGGGESP